MRPPTQRVTLNIWRRSYVSRALRNVGYLFIDITPGCTLTRNVRNCQDPIYQYSIIKCSWSHLTSFETLLHSLEWAAAGIGLHVNAHETEYMCYNQTGDISTLDGTSLKLVDKFAHLGSSVSSTERHRHTTNESMDSYR